MSLNPGRPTTGQAQVGAASIGGPAGEHRAVQDLSGASEPQLALARVGPPVLLLVLAAALYFATLDNGLAPYQLSGGDLITHQYAQAQGKFSNAPGYPLYSMGGWLWFNLGRLIFGANANPIPILSGYSTIWALAALWLLYQLILEGTDRGRGGNRLVAWLATAFYAVTYFFWFYAVTSEQYASAVAWTLLVVWLAFRWERTQRDAYLLWISLMAGVALAHMLTLVLILPPLLWFVLSRKPGLLRRPKLIAAAVGLAALPLLSYAFVYIRGAQHPEWWGAGHWSGTWDWFWSFISTRQGMSELTWSWQPFFTEEFPSLIWHELTWPVLLLGVVGTAWLGLRRAVLLYATLALYFVFCWIDRLGNWFQVIMPAYALIVLGLAAFADRLWLWSRPGSDRDTGNAWAASSSKSSRLARSSLRAGLLVALLALILYRGITSYPRANMRDRPGDTGLDPGWAILADNPPPGTLVFGTLSQELALNYLTKVWGVRQDVRAASADQARAALAARRAPLAATTDVLPLVPKEISADARYSSLGGTLVRLDTAPATVVPGGFSTWNEDFGEGLQLAGARVTRNPATGQTVVVLAWRALSTPQRDLSASVRPLAGGAELAQLDREHPVAGAYPTTRWSAGEVVLDAYSFSLPPGAAVDGVKVILYYRDAAGQYVNVHVRSFPVPPG